VAVSSLSPSSWLLVQAIAALAAKPTYLVGGNVRDHLLDKRSLDLDLIFEGDAIPIGLQLVKQFGGSLTLHKKFHTAVWTIDQIKEQLAQKLSANAATAIASDLPDFIDLISARRETYAHPGALPDVTLGSIDEDQRRRDFTINTMAVHVEVDKVGELLDPCGGEADLVAGLLRVLHAESFIDDPTRILRAMRFAARFDFKLEAKTAGYLRGALPGLAQISADRVRHELELILREEQRIVALEMMQELSILTAIHPALNFASQMVASLSRLPDTQVPDYWQSISHGDLALVLWLMHLDPREAEAVSTHLRLPSAVHKSVVAAAELQFANSLLAGLRPSQLAARLDELPLLAVYALYLQGGPFAEGLERYAREWRNLQPRSNGYRLQQLGLKPGPQYTRILSALRAAWLDGEIASQEEEQVLLEKLIRE
jgi:tRNA nucleotidyltransferase (CCA-adding enzyme)